MREQGGRDADMYVRIHYIDQINPKDSTQFTWGVTDPLLITKKMRKRILYGLFLSLFFLMTSCMGMEVTPSIIIG